MATSKVAPVVGARHTNASGVTGEWNGSTWVKVVDAADTPAPERSWTDAAISTGLRIVPAVAGGLAGTLAGPLAPIAVPVLSAAGGAVGAYLDQLYQGQEFNPMDIVASGALNAIPVGKYVVGAGKAALRAVSPQAERYVAGKLASAAVPIGANVFERAKAANALGLAVKGAAVGAPTAAIENTINRAVQGQGISLQDIGQDLTLGALIGGAARVAPKVAQLPFRKAAPRAGEGIPVRVRQKEYVDDPRRLLDNTADRAAGRPETSSPASVAASRGYTGTINDQLDQASAGIVEASKRIEEGLSKSDVSTIPLSDTGNLTQQLDSLSAYFGGSSKADARSAAANRLANAVRGKVRVDPKVVYDIKKFIDGARSDASFSKDPGQLSSQSALVDLSNSVRSDLKDALPSIAALLDYQHGNYGLLSNLAESGANRPSGLSTADYLAGLATLSSAPVSKTAAATIAVAGLVRKKVAESPRARAVLGNMLNYVAGNRLDEIPQVGDLPTTTIRGELGPGATRIEQYATGDSSFVRAGEGPVIQQVQPRLPPRGSTSYMTGRGRVKQNAGDPNSIPQSPLRAGGANQPGGFGGIISPGGVMPPEQVPFTGSAPIGGQPSRGEPRVRTIPPVLDPDVIVTPVPNRVSPPANVLEGEILQSNAPVVPPVRVSNGETNVAKQERSARKLRTAKPTVEKAPPANATVSKTAQATDTPAEAAKEIQSEVSRVIDVDGVTKAMEIKRRVLAALMEEMEPAKKSLEKWDTSGIDKKGRRVNVPSPYTETILLTIPGDGAFRIPRTPDAITAVMKRITGASSSAWQGVGNVKSPMPVSKPKIPTATW